MIVSLDDFWGRLSVYIELRYQFSQAKCRWEVSRIFQKYIGMIVRCSFFSFNVVGDSCGIFSLAPTIANFTFIKVKTTASWLPWRKKSPHFCWKSWPFFPMWGWHLEFGDWRGIYTTENWQLNTQNDAFGKGDCFRIWPFLVSNC